MPAVRSAIHPNLRMAFPITVFFLACVYSGVLDKIGFLVHVHVLTILGGIALIMIGLVGLVPVILLRDPIGRSITILTVWMCLCVPFAFWPGGSYHVITSYWFKSALAFLMVAGSIVTLQQFQKVAKTMGYSVGVLSILAVGLRGTDHTGRLSLVNTRYDNPNDLAWTLILGLAFLSYLIIRGTRSQRLISIFFSCTILFALVKTGSRAGMVGFGVFAIIGLAEMPRAIRARIIAATPVLLVLALVITPTAMRQRFLTFFATGQEATQLEESAAESAVSRMAALKDSLYLTMTHPLFGVGPGDFPVAQNDLAVSRGERRGLWIVTHNTYTQISSEMGVPGLIIYLVFLYNCIKAIRAIKRYRAAGKDWDDLRLLAKILQAAFIMELTVAIFESYGYEINIPIMAGLAYALNVIARRMAREALAVTRVREPEPQMEESLAPAWMGSR